MPTKYFTSWNKEDDILFDKICRKLRRQLNHFTSRNKADDTHPHVGVLLNESLVLSLGEHANKKEHNILEKVEHHWEFGWHTAKTQHQIRNKYSQKKELRGLSPNFHM